MRKGYRSVAVLGAGLLIASVAVAGGINRHGTATVDGQTIWTIDSPAAESTVFGIVEVRGFVMNNERGIARITLLVDGVAVHDADINKPRRDVRRKYPGFDGEEFPINPGFVTSFLAANYDDGAHTVAIEVLYDDDTLAEGDELTEVFGERSVYVDNTINQPPIGALDSPRDPGTAGYQDYVSGAYPITGWAIDDQGIRMTVDDYGNPRADIEVMVDSRVVGQSLYKLPRPDVANAHPDVAAAFLSGFEMHLDTTRITNGLHEISVRAWDILGKNRVLGSRYIVVDNHYATLEPFGQINWPMPNAHLYTTECVPGEPPSGIEYDYGHRIEWVSGWVVDQNDQQRFEGVKYVELLLDGALLKSTSRDCEYLDVFYMDVNCYGKERPDILLKYPQFSADAKNSGFFFALDIDHLLNLGFHRGLHYLAIRVGTQDPVRPAVIIDQIPVLLECPEWAGYPSYGELERPVWMQDMLGEELIKGWVIEPDGLKQINFYVDGIFDGKLVVPDPKVRIDRPDVVAKYPWLGPPWLVANIGFEYILDTARYVDGVHQLVIETVDNLNRRNYWVQRAVVFNNPN